jgi:flagellin
MNEVFGENHGVPAAGGVHRNLTIGSMAAAINTDAVAATAIQTELADRGVTLASGAAFPATRPVFTEETVTVGAGEFNGRHLWIGANDQRGVDSILVDYGNIDRILARIDGANSNNAEAAITAMDASIEQVSQARADIGALVNRLESTITNLTTSIVNQQAAESQIRDVDFASQASKFTTNQILVQSATSMLSQANASTQSVLSLLR